MDEVAARILADATRLKRHRRLPDRTNRAVGKIDVERASMDVER
jgi:hypothetical protein